MNVIFERVTEWLSFDELLIVALVSKDGLLLSTRELQARNFDVIMHGLRVLVGDLMRKINYEDNENSPIFFARNGRSRYMLNWYTIIGLLLRFQEDDSDINTALSFASGGNYTLLQNLTNSDSKKVSRFVSKAVETYIKPFQRRLPWWIDANQWEKIHVLLCKPFCCLCQNGDNIAIQNARLILSSEIPDILLVCPVCYQLYIGFTRRRDHNVMERIVES